MEIHSQPTPWPASRPAVNKPAATDGTRPAQSGSMLASEGLFLGELEKHLQALPEVSAERLEAARALKDGDYPSEPELRELSAWFLRAWQEETQGSSPAS